MMDESEDEMYASCLEEEKHFRERKSFFRAIITKVRCLKGEEVQKLSLVLGYKRVEHTLAVGIFFLEKKSELTSS